MKKKDRLTDCFDNVFVNNHNNNKYYYSFSLAVHSSLSLCFLEMLEVERTSAVILHCKMFPQALLNLLFFSMKFFE